MDTYVFANQKGGVGKTTVTLGAAELAARRTRVLLVDLDPQASATKVLGINVDGGRSMANVMLEPDRYALSDAIAPTEWDFDLAPSETALASRELRRSTAEEFVLKRQLGTCDGYDVVLVDCPPSLGVLTLNALAAASHLVEAREHEAQPRGAGACSGADTHEHNVPRQRHVAGLDKCQRLDEDAIANVAESRCRRSWPLSGMGLPSTSARERGRGTTLYLN